MPEGINDDAPEDISREEMMSHLFAQMVLQNTNLALMMLGQVPYPDTGKKVVDLETARLLIEQLEMLEVKTRGNLHPVEQRLLQQSLTHLRLTFFQAVEKPPADVPPGPSPAPPTPGPSPASAPETPSESGKRFSKKF